MQHLSTVSWTIRYMDPGVVLLVDKLVEREIESKDQVEEELVFMMIVVACCQFRTYWDAVPSCYVGSLSEQMLRVASAFDGSIESSRAETGVY